MKKLLTLGYSPYDTPSGNPTRPFDKLYSSNSNLKYRDSLVGVDSILLWGGSDICTGFYDNGKYVGSSGPGVATERDLFEWHLLREAYQNNIPIIGVCRGAQLACVFSGGELIQHVTGHHTHHEIKTYDNFTLNVTSSHHQMMFPYYLEAEDYDLLAWCESPLSTVYQPANKGHCQDMEKQIYSEPEIVYFSKTKALAIQSHPEWEGNGPGYQDWLISEIQTTFKLWNVTVPAC